MNKIWLNGNELSRKVTAGVSKAIVGEISQYGGFYGQNPQWAVPQLHILSVGWDSASLSYIRKKMDLATATGIRFHLHQFVPHQQPYPLVFQKILASAQPQYFSLRPMPTQTSHIIQMISNLIQELNQQTEVSGILLQLPLHGELKDFSNDLIGQIDPFKDVDCLTPTNRSALLDSRPHLLPCTPAAVLRILDEHNIPLQGKRAVVIGRSSLVGLPLFHLLLQRNATPTLCHAHTTDLNTITRQADIVVSAVGKHNLVTELKPNAVAIDVGISRSKDGKLGGDILESSKRESRLATPVPGGVGPLTVAMLMENTVQLWIRQMRAQQTN